MKLISTRFTESEVLMRFADDEDEKRAKESIDVRVPISGLNVPLAEGGSKKLDRYFGLEEEGPTHRAITDLDAHTLSEIKKSSLRARPGNP